MHRRCAGAPHEYCLCGKHEPPPPPPPTTADETEWLYASPTTPVDSSGHATAFYKWVADDVRMPERLRTHPTEYSCPGIDTGAAQCARHCSGELGGLLVSFSVGGKIAPPSPPSPPHAPEPPSPPPTPQPPRANRFHGATDVCSDNHIYSGPECRDGGVGSIYPPLCNYGTQNTNCGPRMQYYDNNEHMGDDSCEFAHNNICEDSGPESEYFVDEDGIERARCGYATDMSDCPTRKMESLGDLSFRDVGSPPGPTPPPLTGIPPPPPNTEIVYLGAGACRGPNDDTGTARAGFVTQTGATFEECSASCTTQMTAGIECTGMTFRPSDGLCEIHTMPLVGTFQQQDSDDTACYRHFFACLDICEHTGTCTDGGLGAIPFAGNFLCPYGTQCQSCGVRTNVDWVLSDTAGVNGDGSVTHNGVCEDVAVGGGFGYGTDQTDCGGPRRVIWNTGAPSTEKASGYANAGRRLQFDVSPPPPTEEGRLDPRANEARFGERGDQIPPAPPSPPPPAPTPPPPPSPPPPPRMDWCECACTAAPNRYEDEWSPLALEAFSEPSADTRLYAAYAALERGAEERPAAHIYVEGLVQNVVRYVESRALSLPMAHVTNNWKLTSTPTLRKSYAPLTSMPASFVNACRQQHLQEAWALEAQQPNDGFCSSTNFQSKCLTAAGAGCGPWRVIGDPGIGCYQHYCSTWSTDPLATECLSANQAQCDMCSACFEDSGATTRRLDTVGAPYTDSWRLLPDATLDRTEWFSRCSAECAEQTTMFLLHYVQYNSATGECECYTSDTPEPPDNGELTRFLAENGQYDTSGDVNIWSTGPPSYAGVFEGELGGTLYYAQAFEIGFTMPIYHQPSGEAHVHPRECGNRCIHVLGKDAIAGFVVDPIARTCECIGDSTNDRDPLALHNRAQIAFTVGSTEVMFKAFWCEGSEPDPRTDGAYVYSHRVGSQTWCPGRVPDHMGEAVISGSRAS